MIAPACDGVDDSSGEHMAMIALTHDCVDDSFDGKHCRWLLRQGIALTIALTDDVIDITLAGVSIDESFVRRRAATFMIASASGGIHGYFGGWWN